MQQRPFVKPTEHFWLPVYILYRVYSCDAAALSTDQCCKFTASLSVLTDVLFLFSLFKLDLPTFGHDLRCWLKVGSSVSQQGNTFYHFLDNSQDRDAEVIAFFILFLFRISRWC